MFQCDTQHTGCRLACFNRHSPMSAARFFQMLILLISLPKIFFYLFASHEQAEYEREKLKHQKERQKAGEEYKRKMMGWQKKIQAGMKELPKPDEPNVPEPPSLANAKLSIKKNYYMDNAQEVLWTRRIVTAHLSHFIVLLFLEILGLLFLNWLTQAGVGVEQWKFFDLTMYQYVEHYVCREDNVYLLNTEKLTQCGNGERTECYVSRPSEKKLFLWYMVATALISIILLLADIILLVTTHLTKRKQKKQAAKQQQPSAHSSTAHLNGRLEGSLRKPLLPQ